MRESSCTDTDKDMAYVTVSGISFVCAHDWHVTAYGVAYVFGCIYALQRAVHFPPFFPASFMAPVHLKPLLEICFREEVL